MCFKICVAFFLKVWYNNDIFASECVCGKCQITAELSVLTPRKALTGKGALLGGSGVV